MSLNNVCDICKEMLDLFDKYHDIISHVDDDGLFIEKDDLNLIFNYVNFWSTKHCGCCYKDLNAFLGFDNLMKCVVNTSFELVESITLLSCAETVDPLQNFFSKWSKEDKEKLLQLTAKVYQLSFPLYVTYKHSNFNKNEELSSHESKILSNYCDLTEYDMPIFMMKKIITFIEADGFRLYTQCFKEADPNTLPISFANLLITIIQSIKYYINLNAINAGLVRLRSQVINYLCKIQDNDFKNVTERSMFEYMWSVVKEYNFNHFGIDGDGLKVAFKYFTSSTLTMRLSGIGQINNYINIYNEISHAASSIPDTNLEPSRDELIHWILDNKIVENIFGPNSHIEVIKQSSFLLNFIAAKLTTEQIDIIWCAGQLKHYEKHVFEILCTLIKNLNIKIVCYMYNLLWKIKPEAHSEHTLNLASQVIKYIWLFNGVQPDVIGCPYISNHQQNHHQHHHHHNHHNDQNEKIVDFEMLNRKPNLYTNDGNNIIMDNKGEEPRSKTNSSSSSEIDVSDVDEEDFDMTALNNRDHRNIRGANNKNRNNPPIKNQVQVVDRAKTSKVKSKQFSNNASDSDDFDMEINNGDNSAKLPNTGKEDDEEEDEDDEEEDEDDDDDDDEDDIISTSASVQETFAKIQQPTSVAMIQGERDDDDDDDDDDDEDDDDDDDEDDDLGANNVTKIDTSRGLRRPGPTNNVLSMIWDNDEKQLLQCKSPPLLANDELNGMEIDFGSLGDDEDEDDDEENLMSARIKSNRQSRMFNVGRLNDQSNDENSDTQQNAHYFDGNDRSVFRFNVASVYRPGNTLLWDLLQDEMLNKLNEDTAMAAEKYFWLTIQTASNPDIRIEFINGCLENLAHNRSVITSIRLLQKLFSSFYNYNDGKLTRKIIIDYEKRKKMLELFFENLNLYMRSLLVMGDGDGDGDGGCNPLKSKFHSPKEEIQIRLNFLSFIFIYAGSHENLSFSQEHVNILWNTITKSPYPEIVDEFFDWLLNQVKLNNGLNIDIIKHILLEKMPLLKPESFTLTSLELLQNLHGFILSKNCESNPKTFNTVVRLLWDIAFKNPNQDVSMNASRHLNNYYINLLNCTNRFDREEEFIRSCVGYLKDASVLLPISCAQSLSIIERAVILLKTYLEVFCARYSYFFRTLELNANFDMSMHRIRDKNERLIRILVSSPFNDKNTFEFSVMDYIGDLRAKVQHWWRFLQKGKEYCEQQSNASNTTTTTAQADKLICLVLNEHEISFDYDEKHLIELNFKESQMNHISFHICKHTLNKHSTIVPLSLSEEFFQEFRLKNPKNLLLKTGNFELLFTLMRQLDMINLANLKARILSRNIWEIIQMLPTSMDMLNKFKLLHSKYNAAAHGAVSDSANDSLMFTLDYSYQSPMDVNYEELYQEIFSSDSNQKLIYACQLVENYRKIDKNWPEIFLETNGIGFLYKLLINLVASVKIKRDWTEWKQDCLASLVQILNQFATIQTTLKPTGRGNMDSGVTLKPQHNMVIDCETLPPSQNNPLIAASSPCPAMMNVVMERKSKRLRKNSLEKYSITRFSPEFLQIIVDKEKLLDTIMIMLNCVFVNSKLIYQASILCRAQVVSHTLMFFTSWCYSQDTVLEMFFQSNLAKDVVKKLFIEDVDHMVRKESCQAFLRLFLNLDPDKSVMFLPKFLNLLLSFLEEASSVNLDRIRHRTARFNSNHHSNNGDKETHGQGNKDYFNLVCRLLDHFFQSKFNERPTNNDEEIIDAEELAKIVAEHILTRDNYELRKNQNEDEGLKGLLQLLTVILKNNPWIKRKPESKELIVGIFESLFALPTLQNKELPKCKNVHTRSTAFELLLELGKTDEDNYALLTNLLIDQHRHEILGRNTAYPWEYWPHDESKSDFVGLTNLGATCYMASCMQHLFMLLEVRNAILTTNLSSVMKHESILRELQKMFIFLQESERKAYNPKSFCKVYTMDHQPLNVCEQKDMTEFFTDLISKLEEMTVDLKDVVKKHFSGLQSNNVVSLDCTHISQTMEEFYTLRCQVADMRDLYQSLNELTVKDTLDGDNMYNCSECGKKVRAEKRACIKKLPKILCFNTMRYTFNMTTMTKEKVNTHFSFPFELDMAPYLEKNLINLPNSGTGSDGNIDADGINDYEDEDEKSGTKYELIGVTVHTGTAEGGHYYSFILDRDPHSCTKDKWFLFNDAEVKTFDKTQIATECFGGEMTSKTYDKTNDKFLDFSFEKTNSAYMLFYEKCRVPPDDPDCRPREKEDADDDEEEEEEEEADRKLPQTRTVPLTSYENISKELIDWIWNDNISFIRDRLIFEHAYFDFVWRVCAQTQMPNPTNHQSSQQQCTQLSPICLSNKCALISTRLATLFVLETLIHAKEKPTIANWIELLTKQFNNSRKACEWLMNHLAENDWWSIQILFKCSNQMVRQLFVRLCIHVIVKLEPIHKSSLYVPPINSRDDGDGGQLYSCVARFIRRLIYLINVDAMTIRPNLKYLNEYFSFLLEFARKGDEECRFLLSIDTISTVVNFYLNHGKIYHEFNDSLSDNEDEDFEEKHPTFRPVLDEKYPKIASLEKMISLIVYLIEKAQNYGPHFMLSKSDIDALISNNTFQFIQQQIRDNINLRQTFNLICSLCHLDETLFSSIINMIFSSIIQFPENSTLFFKMLSLITETNLISAYFSKLVLPKIWDLADNTTLHTLEWLNQHVSRNKILHDHVLSSLDHWVNYFLVENSTPRVRSSSALLLLALVPSVDNSFRQNYRAFRSFPYTINKEIVLAKEGQAVVDQLFGFLLNQIKKIKQFADPQMHGTQKLCNYFQVLTYLMVNCRQKRLFIAHFNEFWMLFQNKLSEPAIPIHQNKQAFLMFWYVAAQECKDSIKCIVQNPHVYKKIAYNYILADHDDQEVVMFNKNMLPYYYGLLRLCCEHSRTFTRYLASHQNIQWAFKNISQHSNQYSLAAQELFKLIRIFATIPEDAGDHEIKEVWNFKTMAFKIYLHSLDPNVHWATMIQALNILTDSIEDRLFIIRNNGLCLLFQSFSSLHVMFHQATACNINTEIVDLLKIISSLLDAFEQNYETLADCRANLKMFVEIKKLIFLLNTYTPANLRVALLDVLLKLIKLFPDDHLVDTIKFLLNQHDSFAEQNFVSEIGPYFPKRGQKSFQSKSSLRPSRPIFQMCFNESILETTAERDPKYIKSVLEFYQPYYSFVEEVCRFAIKKDLIFDELIDISVRLSWETLPFHYKHFIHLWWDMQENPEFECTTFLDYLCLYQQFNDYLRTILLKEKCMLDDDQVYRFMEEFLDKVSPPIVTQHSLQAALSALPDQDAVNLREKSTVAKLTWDLISLRLMLSLNTLRDPCTIKALTQKLNRFKEFYSDFQSDDDSGQQQQPPPDKIRKMDDANMESHDSSEPTISVDDEAMKFLYEDSFTDHHKEQREHSLQKNLATEEEVAKLLQVINTLVNIMINYQ